MRLKFSKNLRTVRLGQNLLVLIKKACILQTQMLVLGLQLLFNFYSYKPSGCTNKPLSNWPLPWTNIIRNKNELKQTCTCTTLNAMLHWRTITEKQAISMMILCSRQNKSSSPFLKSTSGMFVACSQANFGHFSASCSFKKVLIKRALHDKSQSKSP